MFRIFHDNDFKKELFKLALPVVIQEILVFLVNTANAFILKVIKGDAAFNGTTSANDVFYIFNIILLSFVFAGSVFAAQYTGKKDTQSVRKIFNLSLKIAFILSLIFTISCLIWPVQIISALTDGSGNIEFGAGYLRVFAIAFIFRGLGAMYYYSIKNAEKTKLIYILSIITFALNVGLTSAFCYVPFSNESMGAAIAATLARFIELVLLIIFTWKMEDTRFSLKYFLHTDPEMLSQYFKYTLAILGSRICWGAGDLLLTKVVVNHIQFSGETMQMAFITANNTVTTVRNLVTCSTAGITAASSVLIGRELGANKLSEAHKHSKDIMRFLLVLAAFNITMSFAYAPLFMISVDKTVDYKSFTQLVWAMSGIYAISYLAQVYNAVINDSFFSIGGDRAAMFISNGLFMWVIVVPLSLTAYFLKWDPLVIFTIANGEEIVKCWANILRYYQKHWIKNIVNPKDNQIGEITYKYINNKSKKGVDASFSYKTFVVHRFVPSKLKEKQAIKEAKNEIMIQQEYGYLKKYAEQYFKACLDDKEFAI